MAEALTRFRDHKALYIGADAFANEAKPVGPKKQSTDPKVVTALDAERLLAISSVKTLYLNACEQGVLGPIARLPALETLRLSSFNHGELDQLAQSKSLVSFGISGVFTNTLKQVIDLRPLALCENLKSLSVEHLRGAEDILLPVNAQLDSLRLVFVPASTVKQCALLPSLRSLWIHTDELPSGELVLENLTELVQLVVFVAAPVRLRLPSSLKYLRVDDSPSLKIAAPEMLTNLEDLVLISLQKVDQARILLELPRLKYVNIDEETRAVIGSVPDKWQTKSSP
jgi:hypothetical protein